MPEWKAIRRSEPAEESPLVPDDCLDYEVWKCGDETLTIYEQGGDEKYFLVRHYLEERKLIDEYDDYKPAKNELEQQKALHWNEV